MQATGSNTQKQSISASQENTSFKTLFSTTNDCATNLNTLAFSCEDGLHYEEKINLVKEAGVFPSKLFTPK